MNKKIITLLFLFCTNSFGMNVFRPHDFFLQMEQQEKRGWQFTLFGQASVGDAKGYDEEGCSVNMLRIWNADQNSLKMLDGFDDTTEIGQLRIRVAANDDGVRGHFLTCGDMSWYGGALTARWGLPQDLSIFVSLPFYHQEVNDVVWTEQTKDVTADDARVKQYLTNDFFNNVTSLGGPCLQAWSRTGIGDLSLLLGWNRDFKQQKETLKNVSLHGRAGFIIPTGKKKDEDKLFSLPFGNDGGLGVLFGGGLHVDLGEYVQTGFDVTLHHVFGNTKCRRIKTHEEQTELLLLAKAETFKDFGLYQQFNLFVKGHNFWNGFFCVLGYQFSRHGDDELSLVDLTYSETIANSAKSLEEWTMHNIFLSLNYKYETEESNYVPQVKLFAQLPFNGRFSAQNNIIGLQVGVDF